MNRSRIFAGMLAVMLSGLVSSGQAQRSDQPSESLNSASPTEASQSSDTSAPALDPTVFHHIAQITWVVGDLDRVVNYWQGLGIHDIHRDGEVSYPNLTYRGKADPAKVKQVTAQVDKLQVKWIQPVSGGKFWRDKLSAQGDGIRVLSYETPSSQIFDEQVRYFASKGVKVVVEDSWQGKTGRCRMAYLDTAPQGGGNTIGLIDDPDARSADGTPAGPANQYPVAKFTHFAFVVKDVQKVNAYYTSLGFQPFSSIDHNISLDRIYRGQPGHYEMWLGWDRTGDASLEWIQQITGPDVYVEYAKAHGEGFHHLGVNVTDMDAAIALMKDRGAPPNQLAAWTSSKGKGRAVYLDTEPYGGVTVELIYDPSKLPQ
jgi:catechol 2,3-dioxygenase-like lactoylglutathione lyase family enzyme